MKKLKNKKLIILGIIMILIVTGVSAGLTYAFFTASVVGNDTASETEITTGTLKLRLNDTNILNMDNAMPGRTETKTFTVENIGTAAAAYDLELIDVSTTFNNTDLVYTLTSNNNGGEKNETILPNTNELISEDVLIDSGVSQQYTLTITFKETGQDQNNLQGSKYSAKIKITPKVVGGIVAGYLKDSNGNVKSNALIELRSDPRRTRTDETGYYEFKNVPAGNHTISVIEDDEIIASRPIVVALSNDVKVDEDNIKISPVIKKYINFGMDNNSGLNITTEQATLVLSETSGDVYIGGTKELIVSGSKFGSLSCISGDNSKAICSVLGNKIKIIPLTVGNGTITIKESKTNVEKTYTFNAKETSLTLNKTSGTVLVGKNLIISASGTNMGTLYCGTSNDTVATCSVNNNEIIISGIAEGNTAITVRESNGNKTQTYSVKVSESLTVMEQILSVEEIKSDASINFLQPSSETNGRGLYYTNDSSVTSYGEDGKRIYYYRGLANNNWVDFGGYKWRIMRTNSENGVKLAYAGDGLTDKSAFLPMTHFTIYDTSSSSVQYKYSTIKLIVDAWYNSSKTNGIECNTTSVSSTETSVTYTGENCDFTSNPSKLSDYYNYLSTTAIYCNDITYWKTVSDIVYYTPDNRIKSSYVRPTFACPASTGGRYTANDSTGNGYLDFPISLISTDEAVYAGIVGFLVTVDSYLTENTSEHWWTQTPRYFYRGVGKMIRIYSNQGLDFITSWDDMGYTRPAISLRSCVTITGGEGSKEHPYTVSDAKCTVQE